MQVGEAVAASAASPNVFHAKSTESLANQQ